MIKCLRQMDLIRLLSPKIMRCDTSRASSLPSSWFALLRGARRHRFSSFSSICDQIIGNRRPAR